MKRHIPWIDFILYGGLALLALVAGTIFLMYAEAAGAIVSIVGMTLGFVVVAVVVFFRWFRSQPDFYEDTYGIAVWTDGISVLKQPAGKDNFKRVVDLFVTELPGLIKKHMAPTAPEQIIESSDLSRMLYQSRVEFRKEKLTVFSKLGWSVKDKAGLQQGKGIMLHWTGSIAGSALFHELLHMVDEVVLKRGPDYRHTNQEWWRMVVELKRIAALTVGVV
jgi:hypothetical protein